MRHKDKWNALKVASFYQSQLLMNGQQVMLLLNMMLYCTCLTSINIWCTRDQTALFPSQERFLKCIQVATIAWFEADSICGSHSVAIPVVLVWPSVFCFFQCLRHYKDTDEKSTLFNGKISWKLHLMFLKQFLSIFSPLSISLEDRLRCWKRRNIADGVLLNHINLRYAVT